MKLASLAAAALASLPILAGQDPRLDYSFLAPILQTDSTAQVTGQAIGVSRTSRSEKTVSVKFRNAKLQDVLNWLDRQGVSYVVAEDVAQDRRLSLNMVNQPIGVVTDSVAAAFGLNVQRRGNVLVFGKGFGWQGGTMNIATPAMPPVPAMPGHFEGLAANPEQWEQFGRDIEVWGEKFGDDFTSDVALTPQQTKELEAHLKAIPKIAESARMEALKAVKSAKGQEELAISLQRVQSTVANADRAIAARGVGINGADVTGLLRSLTKEQRDIQSKKGQLKLSELSDRQRTMIGNPTGKFRISVDVDGDKLTVVND